MNNRWTFRMIDTDLELEHNFVVIQSRWWAGRHKSDNYLLRGRGEKLDWKHDTTLSWPQRDRRGGSFITEIPGRELHLIYINSEPERLLVLFQMITAVWGMTMEGVMMWPAPGELTSVTTRPPSSCVEGPHSGDPVYTNITNKNVIIITIITYCPKAPPLHAHITGGI